MIQFDCQTWFLYGSRQFWIGSLDILIPYGKSINGINDLWTRSWVKSKWRIMSPLSQYVPPGLVLHGTIYKSMDLGSSMIQFDCQTWFLYGSRQFWIGSLDILIPYGKSNEEEATLERQQQCKVATNVTNQATACLCCKMGSKYFWSLIYIFISHSILVSTNLSQKMNFLQNLLFVMTVKLVFITNAREC